MKILAIEWRSAVDTVGIVLIENDFGQQSARIGAIDTDAFGRSEEHDKQYIANTGAKLIYREAKAFFPFIKKGNYKNY
jgi:hypothetical protein